MESGSTSTGTGRAPHSTTASNVAMNVCAGTTTSSPGPMSQARSVIFSASRPLPTPIAERVPQKAANSSSKRSSSSPRM